MISFVAMISESMDSYTIMKRSAARLSGTASKRTVRLLCGLVPLVQCKQEPLLKYCLLLLTMLLQTKVEALLAPSLVQNTVDKVVPWVPLFMSALDNTWTITEMEACLPTTVTNVWCIIAAIVNSQGWPRLRENRRPVEWISGRLLTVELQRLCSNNKRDSIWTLSDGGNYLSSSSSPKAGIEPTTLRVESQPTALYETTSSTAQVARPNNCQALEKIKNKELIWGDGVRRDFPLMKEEWKIKIEHTQFFRKLTFKVHKFGQLKEKNARDCVHLLKHNKQVCSTPGTRQALFQPKNFSFIS